MMKNILLAVSVIGAVACGGENSSQGKNPLSQVKQETLAQWIIALPKHERFPVIKCANHWKKNGKNSVPDTQAEVCENVAKSFAENTSKSGFGDVLEEHVYLPTMWIEVLDQIELKASTSYDPKATKNAVR